MGLCNLREVAERRRKILRNFELKLSTMSFFLNEHAFEIDELNDLLNYNSLSCLSDMANRCFDAR